MKEDEKVVAQFGEVTGQNHPRERAGLLSQEVRPLPQAVLTISRY